MEQTTGLRRTAIDQYYTTPEVARSCVDILRSLVPSERTWIEPSAGTGVFLSLVPEAIGYDIDPKHTRIKRADFLEVPVPNGCVVFGNPPFGRQSTLARKFIRHAAENADWIGFILPRSFTKPSMQKAFPLCFHLVHSSDLPSDSFVVNDAPYDVPCVFQVWKRETTLRSVEEVDAPVGFSFVKKTDPHSFAFRRVGGTAGRCSLPSDQSVQSHYFIRLDDETKTPDILTASMTYTFPTNTTGPRSLSKHEATQFLHACIANPTTG